MAKGTRKGTRKEKPKTTAWEVRSVPTRGQRVAYKRVLWEFGDTFVGSSPRAPTKRNRRKR